MIPDDVSELYQQVILEHNKKPRNYGRLDAPTHSAEGFNPLCGDHFWLTLAVTPKGVIEDIAFEGSGCAISKSSASLMTQTLKGKTLAEARELFEKFHALVVHREVPANAPASLGKLAVFSGIWKFPARVKCASLAWHTLKNALEGADTATTE